MSLEISQPDFSESLQRLNAKFSLGWLLAANCIGLWLALLLVAPDLNAWVGEYTYGRWVPLHLNWQLYGWCSLPMVGMLLKHYLQPGRAAMEQARGALWAWSLALALGGLSWLQGDTSGKLFLDWTGLPRLCLVLAMGFLWGVLAWHYLQMPMRQRRILSLDPWILGLLAGVPAVLYWSTRRTVYPPVDPGTGGPTGASLLGSTLGIVAIFGILPDFLGVIGENRSARRVYWAAFAVDAVVCAMVSHENSSHLDWRQYGALATLVMWIPCLIVYWTGFDWTRRSTKWLWAALVWWTLLVLTGISAFLPGILDGIKFTNALVAHSHLAMAGLLSSVNILVLSNLTSRNTAVTESLASQVPFWMWHTGLAVQLGCLLALAYVEKIDPERFFVGSVNGLLWGRAAGGVLMVAASAYWTCKVFWPERPHRTSNQLPVDAGDFTKAATV